MLFHACLFSVTWAEIVRMSLILLIVIAIHFCRKDLGAIVSGWSTALAVQSQFHLDARLQRPLKKALTFVAASRYAHFSRVERPFGILFRSLLELFFALQTHDSLDLLRRN